MFGKSTRFELGVNHVAVGDHVEYTATAGDQLCIDPQNPLDFVRQTGGPRFVVSFCAVVNFDLHFLSPFLLSSADYHDFALLCCESHSTIDFSYEHVLI